MKHFIKFFILVSVSFNVLYSSIQTVYQYKIYCTTEAKNVFTWSETTPTACPNNTAHTINSSSISIVDESGPDEIFIREESTPTGGHFRAETVVMDIAAGPDVTTTITRSWPYPISVLGFSVAVGAEHEGDVLHIYAPENRIIGALTSSINPTDTVIPVSQTVIDNIAIGFSVKLDDGVNSNDLGDVLSIDKVNNTITMQTAAVNSFSASSPTYVKITVCRVKDFELSKPGIYNIGEKKIGGSYFPANEVAVVKYLNKSASLKKLVIWHEYLY